MATQSVEFRAATGLTLTAKLFSAGSDTEVASVSATEATNRKGTYTAAYTDVAAGEYVLIAFDSTTPVASWWVRLTLTTATFQVYELIDKDGLATSTQASNIETDTQDIQSRLPAALVSGRIDASVGAMASSVITATSIASSAITSDKLATDCITSAQLASTAITEIQSGLATTANVAAVETDTQDIQSRLPAALVSGRMDSSVGAMASSVLTAAALATDAAAEIADAVYDEAYAGHTTPGTYGFLWDQWRKSNPAITGEVTSAVTPTTTTFSTDITGYANGAFENAVLIFINGSTNADFRGVVSGYLQSNGVVTVTPALPQAPVAGDEFTIAIPSFVYTLAQVQSGLATTTQLTTVEGKIDAIDGVTDKLDTTVELDGSVYRFTTNALEQAPSGGGGGSTVIVSPLQAVAPDRVSGTEIMTFINDVSAIGPIAVTDADGVAVDLSALTLKVCIEKIDGTILANVTPSVSGVDNNQITFTPNADSVAKTGTFRWSLRRTINNQVYAYGDFVVDAAARIS